MTSFLTPADAPEFYESDLADLGYVMNLSRVWAHQPSAHAALFGLLGDLVTAHGLTMRQRGILVAASASSLNDSYCSLAWGSKLAKETGADTAAGVLRGDDSGLDPSEQALARWARKVVRQPNQTTVADVQELRAAGFGDPQIFGITLFIALRLAFSTVNDALGVQPDSVYRDSAPQAVLAAVDYGRPIDAD